MGSQPDPHAPVAISRRQLREQAAQAERAQRRGKPTPIVAQATAAEPRSSVLSSGQQSAPKAAKNRQAVPRGPVSRPASWTVRLGVLAALAGVTVVVPLTQKSLPTGGFAADIQAQIELPSTVEALSSSTSPGLPSSLISTDAQALRSTVTTSRSEEREELAGCDGATRAPGTNGQLRTGDLCTLWDGKTQLRADAAVSLAVLNQAFVARFGADMCLSSGYRTLSQQISVKAQKGGLAAAPGKSNHGWGLAVDLCSSETSGSKWTWLNQNAPSYGWDNPEWARPGGSGPYERWHWEYTQGVKDDGEYYG
ncbi:M15 family metallopeptidase [Cellulomonas timonensis]|uniref:M15 family metallopeptidase n=1 Tax=Cellulomonas timonensis TaxID=1689271 RepID=UPI00082F0E24|nr:M15 family metallopeptidase [Cellulomonas timonensis]